MPYNILSKFVSRFFHTQANRQLPQYFRDAFLNQLSRLRANNIYREYFEVVRIAGKAPYMIWKKKDGTRSEIISFCSLDYLNLSEHPRVIRALIQSANRHGIGSGGSRAIGGNSSSIVRLEQKLADFHGFEDGVVFTSGFVANGGAIQTLAADSEDIVCISDEENHASIIDGIKISGTEKQIFRHNDMEHLEELLKKAASNSKKPIILCESVYSMSGSIAKLKEINWLADKYKALWYVDEVHAVGVYGPGGRGIAAREGIKPDIIQATLSKAFGTHGGYIVASKLICDFLRRKARPFIFTTSLPPALLDAAACSIDVAEKMEAEREYLAVLSSTLKQKLRNAKIPIKPSEAHIIPVMIGDPEKCKKISDILMNEFHLYAHPILPPTVPTNKAQLRISLNVAHKLEHIDQLVNGLSHAFEVTESNRQRMVKF